MNERKLWWRIAFAGGFLLSQLVYWRYGSDALRILAVVTVIVWGLLFALQRVAATDTQESLGRYGSAVAGGYVVGAFATLLAWMLSSAMGWQT